MTHLHFSVAREGEVRGKLTVSSPHRLNRNRESGQRDRTGQRGKPKRKKVAKERESPSGCGWFVKEIEEGKSSKEQTVWEGRRRKILWGKAIRGQKGTFGEGIIKGANRLGDKEKAVGIGMAVRRRRNLWGKAIRGQKDSFGEGKSSKEQTVWEREESYRDRDGCQKTKKPLGKSDQRTERLLRGGNHQRGKPSGRDGKAIGIGMAVRRRRNLWEKSNQRTERLLRGGKTIRECENLRVRESR